MSLQDFPVNHHPLGYQEGYFSLERQDSPPKSASNDDDDDDGPKYFR